MTTQLISTGELESKTGPELVSIYNELCPGKPVKRFASIAAGVKRILKLLADDPKLNAAQATVKPQPSKTRKESRPKPKTGRRSTFSLPPAKEVREARAGTKRAQVVDLLRKGTTFEGVMDAIGWDRRTAYEGIKLVNVQLGYGIEEDESGVIRLVEAN